MSNLSVCARFVLSNHALRSILLLQQARSVSVQILYCMLLRVLIAFLSIDREVSSTTSLCCKALLDYICVKPWAHRMDNVSGTIIEYLAQTNSYKAIEPLLATGQHGVEIHFYKNDPDEPGTHSCRQIMAIPNDIWQAKVDEWLACR
jgi:hypothetical protein